jgi:hypothetical protein
VLTAEPAQKNWMTNNMVNYGVGGGNYGGVTEEASKESLPLTGVERRSAESEMKSERKLIFDWSGKAGFQPHEPRHSE